MYCSVKNYSPTRGPNRPSNLHWRREAIQKWIPLAASPNPQTPTVVPEGSAKLFERVHGATDWFRGGRRRARPRRRQAPPKEGSVLSPVRRSPSTQNCSISLGLAVGNGRQLVDPSWLSGSCVILGGGDGEEDLSATGTMIAIAAVDRGGGMVLICGRISVDPRSWLSGGARRRRSAY